VQGEGGRNDPSIVYTYEYRKKIKDRSHPKTWLGSLKNNNKNKNKKMMARHGGATPIILALGRLRQEDCKF
jgi:uncharacterized lipoprotein YehR (DUF1307 family)